MNIIQKCRVSTYSNSFKYLGTLRINVMTQTSLSYLQFFFNLKALILFALSPNKREMFSKV